MKRIVVLLASLMITVLTVAQDYGRIAVNVIVPPMPDVPEEARAALETKMQQVATQYGLASNGVTDRFVMTAKVNVTGKDITPTTPVKISQRLEVTMFIGDIVDNKVYESVVLAVSGIGQSETQSMIQAFNLIKPSNPRLKAFVENAERKIVEYYTNNCQFILTEANTLASNRQHDAAIAMLMAVLEVCASCYEQCMEKAIEVYQMKIDHEGDIMVQQARSAWLSRRDYDAASEALRIMAVIDPQSSAQNGAQDLIYEIDKHLRSVEASIEAQRREEWDFIKKQYEDSLALARQRQADNTALRREQIAAARAVGVAFGNHQPSVVYRIVRTW